MIKDQPMNPECAGVYGQRFDNNEFKNNDKATHYTRTGNEELKGDIQPMAQVNHLDNVCIMQKYNDSEKVLELRKEFQESEAHIVKCVNVHDELVNMLHKVIDTIESNCGWNDTGLFKEDIEQALKKASQ